MRLNGRIGRLENRTPRVVVRRPVPAGSMAEFARGALAGAFTPADLDPTDPKHVKFVTMLVTLLTLLTPEHRAWCAANPWAPSPEAEWARVVGVESMPAFAGLIRSITEKEA